MMNTKDTAADLEYVRRSVERAERNSSPAGIYWLWAVISLIGFSLVDFAPEIVGLFWMIASPLGFVVSMWLGYRSGKRTGQMDRAEGVAWATHWLMVMIVIFLSVMAALTGVMDWRAFMANVILLTGLSYLLAGVHLERRMLWVGVLMLVCYPAALLMETYVWTLIGVVFAVAMIATALIGRDARDV